MLDIGCGDGTYTHGLASLARPARVHGLDPAAGAVDVARAKQASDGPVSFEVASARINDP